MGISCRRGLWTAREQQGRESQGISTLEREVSSSPKNWRSVLWVIILGRQWESQKQVAFSRLKFQSHSFNFYLWSVFAIHVFPILLPSSWGDPSHSSFCGLSAPVRQFQSETVQNSETLAVSQGHLEHLYAKCVVQVGSTLHKILFDFLFLGSVFSCWLRAGREALAILCRTFVHFLSSWSKGDQ